jgi:lactate racemase
VSARRRSATGRASALATVWNGRERVALDLPFPRPRVLACRRPPVAPGPLDRACREFFRRHGRAFTGTRVGVIIPDHTREAHLRRVLPVLARELERRAARVEYVVALGLHRPLPPRVRARWLGPDFLRGRRVRMHDPARARLAGTAEGAPVWLDPRLTAYDVLFTVGVVEPHLYAGFSGGVKGIAIGLAGEATVLATHAVKFLSRPGVQVARLRGNPFQRFVRAAARLPGKPVYSLNLVNGPDQCPAFHAFGPAGPSFAAANAFARRLYTCRVRRPYDALFVGCDQPKDRSFYQASRLFNYVLDKKPLVRRGGAIVVFAHPGLDAPSAAERNFERILARRVPAGYAYARPGEHRAFKVRQAARRARLVLVARRFSASRFPALHVVRTPAEAVAWVKSEYGDRARVGVVPLGFSFIPA